jgi:HD-like signal output (HDOD) protein
MTAPEATDTAAMIAAAIGQLATLPEIALEVMRVAEDPQSTGDDLNRVLSNDPTLSARVLKIVNSAYYGVRREVTSISTAIAILGFGAVKSIAVAASLTRMFRAGHVAGAFEARELWKHSIGVATASRLLATRCKAVEPSDAFLAGLMHDIGIIVEMQSCREAFTDVVTAVVADAGLGFRDAETRYLGATHEAFGEALCVTWRFPLALQQVTAYHHRPLELPASERALAAIVHVADHLALRAGVGYGRTVEGEVIDPSILEALRLSDGDLTAVSDVLAERVGEVFPLLTGE